jgi:plastocyanin
MRAVDRRPVAHVDARRCGALASARVFWRALVFTAGMLFVTASAVAATHVVVIENMRFNPSDLTVNIGDSVVWVNKDLFPHTASASSKTFDSGSIGSGGAWRYKASQAGSYPYVCRFHPVMHCTLTVR